MILQIIKFIIVFVVSHFVFNVHKFESIKKLIIVDKFYSNIFKMIIIIDIILLFFYTKSVSSLNEILFFVMIYIIFLSNTVLYLPLYFKCKKEYN